MLRNKSKELHKKVKKMSANECHEFITSVVMIHNGTIIDDVEEVLHEELGFGKVRTERFLNKLQEKLESKRE